MRLSTKARYAVMALLDMLNVGMETPVSLVSISERQSLPLPYLEQIFARLRKSGIVKSSRGALGGYLLARDSTSITLFEVIVSVDKEFRSKRCLNAGVGCQPGGVKCMTHDLWAKLDDVIETFFKKLSLFDVYKGNVSSMAFDMPDSSGIELNSYKIKAV
jgi:Rrf2 family iron-sulfur cluster assembly transcriptional regulator